MATCNPCVSLPCSNQGDLVVYSLQTGIQFNSPTISVIVNCPAGSTCVGFPKTVTYPPGTFVFNLPDPNPPSGTVLRMNGCLGAVTRIVPANATAAEIAALVQEIFQEIAEQQAECDTIQSNPPPSTPQQNDAQSQVIDCDEDENAVFTGSLPSYITLDSDTNTFTISGGIFAGATKSEANATAAAFLAQFISDNADSIECVGCEIIVVAIGPPIVGVPYSQVIAQTGFDTPFWSISAGALPPGLTINSGTGEIAGTATTGGPYTFTVRAAFEEDSEVYCEHEFSFTLTELFADMVWVQTGDTIFPPGTSDWNGEGKEFLISGSAGSPGGRVTQTIRGTMTWVGTGSTIPSKISSLTDSNASPFYPNGSNFIQVRVNAVLVLSIGGAVLEVPGVHEGTFDLPAATQDVQVDIGIDAPFVGGFDPTIMEFDGSLEYAPP